MHDFTQNSQHFYKSLHLLPPVGSASWHKYLHLSLQPDCKEPTADSRSEENEGGPDIINIIRKTRMDIKTFPAWSEQPMSSPAGFLPNFFDPSWCILYEQLAAQTTAAANQLSCMFVYSILSLLLSVHLVFSRYVHSVQTTN